MRLTLLILLWAQTTLAATVVIDGTQTNQIIEGFGVNANPRSWSTNELAPVLDALIDQAGLTLFRIVFDNTDWEAVNDNADPAVMNWTYYYALYGSNMFARLWDVTAYLNIRGLSNGVLFSFMEPGPAWMGSGTPSAGKEEEWAEMITSLLLYARNKRGLRFKLVAPTNEPNVANDGITMNAVRNVNFLRRLALQLDAHSLADVRFVAPDLAGNDPAYRTAIAADPVILGKLTHLGVYSYGSSAGIIQDPAWSCCVTEFNVWCTTCDGDVRGAFDWAYCRGTAEYLLRDLANGVAAAIIWEGYDSFYRHPPSAWSFWGLFGAYDENAPVKTYTPCKNFYTIAQISKFVPPGAQRVAVHGATDPFGLLLAFRHAKHGSVTIVGINNSASHATLNATRSGLRAVNIFELHYTSPTANLASAGTVPVVGCQCSAVIPADCMLTLMSSTSVGVGIINHASGTVFGLPATIPTQTAAFTTKTSIAQVKFFQSNTRLGAETAASFSFIKGNVHTGQYTFAAHAADITATLTWHRYNYGPCQEPILTGGGRDLLYCLYTTNIASDAWRHNHGLVGVTPHPDTDIDDVSVLFKYAKAFNPLVACAAAPWTIGRLTDFSAAPYVAMTYRQNKAGINPRFEAVVFRSLFHGGEATDGVVKTRHEDAKAERRVASRDAMPVNEANQRFTRLLVYEP